MSLRRRSYVLPALLALAACSSAGGGPAQDSFDSLADAGGGTSAADGGVIEDAGAAQQDVSVPGDDNPNDDVPVDPSLEGWTLTWSDEFNGPDGSPVDPTKWVHDVRGDGGGNKELQYYTDGTQNAVQRGGKLVITATTDGAEQYECWYGKCRYTSARLTTKGVFSQMYGRFSARMKLPIGKGFWPAFWMLGTNIDKVGWPKCGEIDILETVGSDIRKAYSTVHTTIPGLNPQGTYTLPNKEKYSDAFHTFAVEWGPGVARFYVDEKAYHTVTAQDVPNAWLYDHPLYMLLNLAVGGTWPGSPDSTTMFPQAMEVDWVRVYRRPGT